MAKASEYEKVYKTRYSNDKQVAPYNGIENISDAEEIADFINEIKSGIYPITYFKAMYGGEVK